MKYYIISILAFSILSCVEKQSNSQLITVEDETTKLTEAQLIAQNNGMANWDEVSQIDFTFNVDRNGENVAQRSWSWKPKANEVTMMKAMDTLTYNRASIGSSMIRTDQAFINDKFWLLAPFQISWDEGTTINVTDSVMSPLSRKRSKKLTVLYNNDVGYTPGDAYDYFYGDDYQISEWIYRKENSQDPTMMSTFEDYKNFNGLNISTSHQNEEGTFRLYFTDIKVTK